MNCGLTWTVEELNESPRYCGPDMASPVVILDLQFELTIHIFAAKPLNGALDLNCPCRFYRRAHALTTYTDARSGCTCGNMSEWSSQLSPKVLVLPRDPANFKIIPTIKQRFSAHHAIDVKAHLRFHVHMRQLSAQTSAITRSNTKKSKSSCTQSL